MNVRPVRNENDYEFALRRVAALMELKPEPGTDAFDELDVWVTLIEDYESKNHPIGKADPVETIQFHLERLGWTQAELAKNADIQATHLSSVLNRRRELTLSQIKKLCAVFDIPADHLIRDLSDTRGTVATA